MAFFDSPGLFIGHHQAHQKPSSIIPLPQDSQREARRLELQRLWEVEKLIWELVAIRVGVFGS
jgi:hypothetical protein